MKGLYKIQNKKTKQFYIGSSVNIQKRWKRHLRDLKNNYHHNIYLQRAFDKYGLENFELVILKECENIREEEQNYLNTMDWIESYNICKSSIGGDNISNHPNKEEIIKKLIKNLEKFRYKVPVLFGKENPNWKGGTSLKICKCGNKMAYYAEKCIKCSNKKEENPFFNKKHSEETKNHLSKVNSERGYVGTQEKKVQIENQEYKSVSEAGRQLGVTPNTIINRIRNPKFTNYKYI